MRYLLIDRVLRLERNRFVEAIKNVTLSEDIYANHFPGFPVMPGALMIEAAAQAGTALLEVSGNFEKKALLAMVERAKFRSFVRPGDQLNISVRIRQSSEDLARIDAELRVRDAVVMNANLVFSLQSASRFYTEKTRNLVEAVYETWLEGAEMAGFE